MKTKVQLVRVRREVAEVEVEVPDIISIEGNNDQELYSNLSDTILELAQQKVDLCGCWKKEKYASKASFNNVYDKKLDVNENICICGHTYHRHFDTYEDMRPIGCKYCGCHCFVKNAENE